MNNINAGILYLPVEKFYNLDLIEAYLKIAYENNFPKIFWIEQTLWAIFVSKYRDTFRRLPDSYQILKQPITDRTISHHFASRRSRKDFYKKGLKRLKEMKFLSEFNNSFT